MTTLYIVVTSVAAAFNLGSGILTLFRLKRIFPLFDGAGIPHSWMIFPVGVLKTAGGLGLTLGLLGVPWVGTAAGVGLVLFWVCAVYTHALTNFWPRETFLTFTFLGLAVGSFALRLLEYA